MKEDRYIILAYNFFQLAKEAINEMETQGNPYLIIYGYEYNGDTEQNTRWSDSNIGVPVLFNFYHGLELFMKGLQYRASSVSKSKDHNLQKLFSELVKSEYQIPKKLILLLKKYIYSENPFQRFFEDNGGTANDFYTFLKYPESKTNKDFIFRSN